MAITKIRRIFLDMILNITPDVYGTYVTTYRKVIKKIITQFMNSIYGTMVKSLIYYCKFFKMLKFNRFKMNPYDPCVENQMANGLKQYVLFNVDHCKLIHKDPKLNGSFIGVICD